MAIKFQLDPVLERDTFFVGDFLLSRLLLVNDENYPWFILVPRVFAITEIYQLTKEQQQQLISESSCLSKWLMEEYQGDKLNIGAIGNKVSQLHLHHIVRFKKDQAWPEPVWGAYPAVPYHLDEAEKLIELVSERLSIDFL